MDLLRITNRIVCTNISRVCRFCEARGGGIKSSPDEKCGNSKTTDFGQAVCFEIQPYQ